MKKTIVLGMSILLFLSCNNSEKTTSSEEVEIHTEAHNKESAEAIELNNGERWVVNEEMKPYVLNGSELTNTYIQEGQKDYKVLAEQLKGQNDQLIRSCTMTGKSHDELHKWLHPHLELVKELENGTDGAQVNKIVSQLQLSYQKYHEYFQ